MSFVTNVTCAREVYKKFLSFFNTEGVFVCQHDTRASDNSDSQCPIKVSGVPLTKNDALGRLNASRVPALGCGWEYLVLRGLHAYSDDQRQIPDIGSRKPRIIADPMVSKLFCISILSNCDWIAPLSAGVCSDICDVSAHADNEIQRAVTVSSFFIFLCLPPHYDTNKLGSLCKRFTRVRLGGATLPHSEFSRALACGTKGSSSRTRYTGGSHRQPFLVTAPAQGGSGQFIPNNVATLI